MKIYRYDSSVDYEAVYQEKMAMSTESMGLKIVSKTCSVFYNKMVSKMKKNEKIKNFRSLRPGPFGLVSKKTTMAIEGLKKHMGAHIEDCFTINDGTKDLRSVKVINDVLKKSGSDTGFSTRSEFLKAQLDAHWNAIDIYRKHVNGGKNVGKRTIDDQFLACNPLGVKAMILEYLYNSKDVNTSMALVRIQARNKDPEVQDKVNYIRSFFIGMEVLLRSATFAATFSQLHAEAHNSGSIVSIFKSMVYKEAGKAWGVRTYPLLFTIACMAKAEKPLLSNTISAFFKAELRPELKGQKVAQESGDMESGALIEGLEYMERAEQRWVYANESGDDDSIFSFNFFSMLATAFVGVMVAIQTIAVSLFTLEFMTSNYKKMAELRDVLEALTIHIEYNKKNLDGLQKSKGDKEKIERLKTIINKQEDVQQNLKKQYDLIATKERDYLADNSNEYVPNWVVTSDDEETTKQVSIINGDEIISKLKRPDNLKAAVSVAANNLDNNNSGTKTNNTSNDTANDEPISVSF